MKTVFFCHSIYSDWNHGNAHFLRGVASELLARGHKVTLFEPQNAWSLEHLIQDHGTEPMEAFRRAYPELAAVSHRFDPETLNLHEALSDADTVIVHEWNSPSLVQRIGQHRNSHHHYRLFFHDTHHRMVTNPTEMSRYDLRYYDGVLGFGKVIADLYLQRGLVPRAWTWHEAADITRFRPVADVEKNLDLVWVGNWGDEERTRELEEFLLGPVEDMGLKTAVRGVRYPESGLRRLQEAGIRYQGWIANFRVPEVFAGARMTVHVPRRPYVKALPGIPTIRVFEALACGIPLVSAPWSDAEGLFCPGEDFLVARDRTETKKHLSFIMHHPDAAAAMATRGLQRIRERHTCAHRVSELLQIRDEVDR
ncbi:MAG: glycosyltransferase [Bdellovibrionales bacterium]